MDQLVLIARRMSSMTPGGKPSSKARADGTMRLSASEAARSGAGKLIATYWRSSRRAGSMPRTDFVRKSAERAWARANRPRLYDANGELSVEGIAIGGGAGVRAYDDSVFRARAGRCRTTTSSRSAARMVDAAGAWAQLRADISGWRVPAHPDITGDLLDALRPVIRCAR